MTDPLALRSESIAEFTFKAVAAGVVLGVLFGAANAYLGLQTEQIWAGTASVKQALANAIKRGNEQLAKFEKANAEH